MKKRLVILSALLAFVMLSGNALALVEPASGDALASYAMDPNKKYEFTITGWTAGPVDNENAPVLDWVEQNTGVRAVFDNIDGQQYNDLINVRLASGDAPDVFSLTPHATMTKFYQQGILRTISEDKLAALAPDFYQLYMKDAPEAFNIVRLPEDPNQLMAIPQYKFHAQFIYPNVWRKDWLTKVGIGAVPDNLQEFEDAMYKFAKNDPDGNGKDDTFGLSSTGMRAVYGAYGFIPDKWAKLPDGTIGFGAVQPAMKDALAKLAQWYKDGVIDPDFVKGWPTSAGAGAENYGGRGDLTQAFHTDRIGVSTHGDYWTWCEETPLGLNYQEFLKTHDDPANQLAITPPILANDGKSRITNRANLTQNTFWCFSADMTDDELAAVLKVFNWDYMSMDNYRTIWYGIEGQHWDWDENHLSQPTGDYAKDKGLQNKIGAYTTLGAIIEPFEFQAGVRGNLAKWAESLNLSDPTFEKYGLIDQLLVTPPSYNIYWTELDKMQKEAYIDIITGVQPVDSFDTFVQNWMNGGGQVITQEANDWYATLK